MRKLCAIFAHPDDESFSVAGTLARYADNGVEVTLITATRGEAGEVVVPGVDRRTLGEFREGELRRAAAALGVAHLRLLGLPDGHLSGHGEELRAGIRQTLREVRPQVVVTEDVQGITGHPDHVAVTAAVVRSFDELGEEGALKLYEHVIPMSIAGDGRLGTPDDYITTAVDVEPWADRILAALQAHRSQIDQATLDRLQRYRPWRNRYVCVRSRVPILIPETDLFAGVPA